MSLQEKKYDTKIEPNEHIIVRLDGHKFSTFTKDFYKPFDNIIGNAMKQVTIDLVLKFNASTGYTQSDEITLFIPFTERKHIYNGRIQKLNSLITSFTTTKFNEYIQKHKKVSALFDCRIYGVYTKYDVFSEFLDRMRNAEKNSRSVFAQTYCPHKSLQNLNGKEQVDLCRNKFGKNWDEIEERYKYGVLVKKEKIRKLIINQWHDGYVTRTIAKEWTEKMNYSQNNVNTIFSKFLN